MMKEINDKKIVLNSNRKWGGERMLC